MEKIRVIYNGKEYFHRNQEASGFCEIVEVDAPHKVLLVHFSELKPRLDFKTDKTIDKPPLK